MSLTVTILAAGNGKRMNDANATINLPKVLQLVNKEPMLVKIIKTVTTSSLPVEKLFIIVNNSNISIIKSTLEKYLPFVYEKLFFVVQDTPLGTGHAVLQTIKLLPNHKYNMILNGDTPMLLPETLTSIYTNFLNNYKQGTNNLLIVGINLNKPEANGRIIVTDNKIQIVEYKDCNEQQQNINLVNTGIYVADSSLLVLHLPQITNNNKQNEYYLTDIVKLASENNSNIILHTLDSNKYNEIYNVNTRDELNYVNKIVQNCS